MAQGRDEAAWEHTSAIMAEIANLVPRIFGGKCVSAQSLNPAARKKQAAEVDVTASPEAMSEFKKLFKS